MQNGLTWSSQAIGLLVTVLVVAGCAAEQSGTAVAEAGSDHEAIFGLSIAERVRAAVQQAVQGNPVHEHLASQAPVAFAHAGMTAPMPLAEGTFLVTTASFSDDLSRGFVLLDIVTADGIISDRRDPQAWRVRQSIAAYLELEAHGVQQLMQQVQETRPHGDGLFGAVTANQLVEDLRRLPAHWQSALQVKAVHAWTLTAEQHAMGHAPRQVTANVSPDGSGLLQAVDAILLNPALTNGPQGWLPRLVAGQVQVPSFDDVLAWLAFGVVVVMALIVMAIGIAAVGTLVAGAATALTVVATALAYIVVVGAFAYVAYCFYEQAVTQATCVPKLRAIVDAAT